VVSPYSVVLSARYPFQQDCRLTFSPVEHRYWVDGSSRLLRSVTSLVKTKPFDAQLVAAIVARRGKCDRSVVRARWADATEAGTLLHLAIHNYYNGFTVDPLVTARVEWQYFLNFIRDHPNLRPVRTEFGMFCWRLRLCGTLDILYFHVLTKTFYVCDWKNVKLVTPAKIQEWKQQIGMYVYMLRNDYHLTVTKMIAIVLHSTNTNYVTIDLDLDEAYDAWVDTVVAARLREVQAALEADKAAIVERDAARAVIRGIVQAGEHGGDNTERGHSTTTENAGADSTTSGIWGSGDLRGKTVSFSGSFPDAAELQRQAVAAGMTLCSRRTPTDIVVVGKGGEGTVAAAQATARRGQLITPHSFAAAAAAAARAHNAGCTAEAAAAAASGAQGWPAAPAAAPTPAAAASNGKNKPRKRAKVNTQAQPRALWCNPGVYVASQCGPWQRPASFADTAATEAAIAREAARIVTFLREHTPAGDELALHAAVYVVRYCEHCWL
jgi:hypothetical protein